MAHAKPAPHDPDVYFVPHDSKWPLFASVALFLTMLGLASWFNEASWGRPMFFVGAAVLALILTAGVSLILPMAVRRVVDGFGSDALLLDTYFTAFLGIAALLAVGTGLRYYLVTRLGERVVADIRKAVFDRVISLSPGFYERVMSGEVLSRITTDTTVILSVLGSIYAGIATATEVSAIAGLAREDGRLFDGDPDLHEEM